MNKKLLKDKTWELEEKALATLYKIAIERTNIKQKLIIWCKEKITVSLQQENKIFSLYKKQNKR